MICVMYEWPSVHWHFIELNLFMRLHSLMVWDLVAKELLLKGIYGWILIVGQW